LGDSRWGLEGGRERMYNYRELRVWQAGMELAKDVYVLTRAFPSHEMYELTSQLRRAVASVPANIAEGHTRDSTKEFLRHLAIARGSLAEVETFLLLSRDLGYCECEAVTTLLKRCEEESKMLNALQQSLRKRLNSQGQSPTPKPQSPIPNPQPLP
jgi:four helix bundle protein